MLTEVTPDAIRNQVRAFLAGHDPAEMAKQDFLNARFDAGLAWVHYPEGLGGLGVSRTLQSIVDAEFAAAGAPRRYVGGGHAARDVHGQDDGARGVGRRDGRRRTGDGDREHGSAGDGEPDAP